jgi:chitinase
MSLNQVRTTRSNGFRISSLSLGLAVAASLGGCDVPPETAEDVQAISSGLMAVMENGTIADSPTGPVEMQFSIARPFDSNTTALNVTFRTLDFGSNQATAGTSCTAGVDYIAVAGRALQFPAGVTTITTSVTVCPDSLVEGPQTFATSVVETATNRCDGERCAAIGTITDPVAAAPALPSLRINDVTVNECLKGSCLATFTVSLSAASTSDVSVSAATASDTAQSTIGGCLYGFLRPDFAAVSRALTIPAGATSTTVSVTICGDTIAEPIERFFMNLSNPVNATIADGHGIATIVD